MSADIEGGQNLAWFQAHTAAQREGKPAPDLRDPKVIAELFAWAVIPYTDTHDSPFNEEAFIAYCKAEWGLPEDTPEDLIVDALLMYDVHGISSTEPGWWSWS